MRSERSEAILTRLVSYSVGWLRHTEEDVIR